MIGILISTHLRLGEKLLKVAELIKGTLSDVALVSVEENKTMEEIGNKMEAAIKKLDQGDGVLILTDIFGGTPSNISFSFIKNHKVEVVTGVNLPMLLKLYDARAGKNLREIACTVKESGRGNIYVAGQFLEKKPSA